MSASPPFDGKRFLLIESRREPGAGTLVRGLAFCEAISSVSRGLDVVLALRFLNISVLDAKLKFGNEGLGSLKLESAQLSRRAFSLLLTCSWTLSKRVSSPREDAKDRVRYTSKEPSELDRRNLGVGRSLNIWGDGAMVEVLSSLNSR